MRLTRSSQRIKEESTSKKFVAQYRAPVTSTVIIFTRSTASMTQSSTHREVVHISTRTTWIKHRSIWLIKSSPVRMMIIWNQFQQYLNPRIKKVDFQSHKALPYSKYPSSHAHSRNSTLTRRRKVCRIYNQMIEKIWSARWVQPRLTCCNRIYRS